MEECIICFYDKPIQDYICFSCGHRVCSTCYPLMNNICPVCRYKEIDLIHVEIVVPTIQMNPVSVINYGRILLNTICAVFCCAIIYVVIIIPIQKLN